MKLIKIFADSDALPTLKYRFWSILAGGVLLAFSGIWFKPNEQGFYFTFLSIGALQVFFELGLNYVATQIVAHEAANIEKDFNQHKENKSLNRISQLYRFLRKWYLIAAPMFFCVSTLIGALVFSRQLDIPFHEWLIPWILLVFFTSINLYFSPLFAVAEGMGEVGSVAKFRLKQSILGNVLMWTSFSLGWGLWGAWIVQGTAAIFTFLFVMKDEAIAQHFRRLNCNELIEASFNWKEDLLPMQWRIALSWASGYLLFQSLTPIVMLNRGADEAGRVGLAIAGFNAVISLGMSWINAKGPAIATFIAKKNLYEARKLYIENSIYTTSLVFLGSCIIVLIKFFFTEENFGGFIRLPDLPAIIALTVNSIINSIIFAAAVFMRAHKVEPMVAVSLVGGVISMSVFYLGSLYSTTIAVVAYTSVTTFIIFPWTVYILYRFTKSRS